MTTERSQIGWRALLACIYVAVFLTGAAGLAYQVVWQRYLSRLLGADALATAVILATFLGGLSLGYLACGMLTRRVRNQLLLYAGLEAFIGLWGLAFPWIYTQVEALTDAWSFAPPFLMILQGLAAALLLLLPATLCMGGTVPVLTRGISRTLTHSTRVHAWLYAINTAGACLGTLVTGFLLISWLGLKGSLVLAAGINVTAAAFFFVASQLTARNARFVPTCDLETSADRRPEDAASRFRPWQICAIAFLSGCYVMALESIIIRVTGLTLGASSHAFALIVGVFVLALALGSLVVGRLKHLRGSYLFYNQVAITLLLIPIFLTLDKWPYAGHLVRVTFQPNPLGFWAYQGTIFVALLCLLGLPVAIMGATIPLAFHELKRTLWQVGVHSGVVLFANGLGAMVGSIAGGFALYYAISLGSAYWLCITLAAVAATVASLPLGRAALVSAATLLVLVTAVATVQPFYDEQRFAHGTFRIRTQLDGSFAGPSAFYETLYEGRELPFFRTGPSGTVAVMRSHDPKYPGHVAMSLFVNGRSESEVNTHGELSTYDDRTIRLAAHIPALFARHRDNVLVIGQGTGVTLGELSLYPDFTRLGLAEISETVLEAFPLFDEFNNAVRRDPRFVLYQGDALRTLRRTPEKWDIIISEPSNPFVSGVDQLFNREFYSLARSRLKEDGVLLQWIQGYSTSPLIFSLILTAVQSEFDNIYVFEGAPEDYLVLATPKPLGRQDVQRARTYIKQHPDIARSIREVMGEDEREITFHQQPALIVMAQALRHMGAETADHPRIHHLAWRQLFYGQSLLPAIAAVNETQDAKALARRYERNWRSDTPKAILPSRN